MQVSSLFRTANGLIQKYVAEPKVSSVTAIELVDNNGFFSGTVKDSQCNRPLFSTSSVRKGTESIGNYLFVPDDVSKFRPHMTRFTDKLGSERTFYKSDFVSHKV